VGGMGIAGCAALLVGVVSWPWRGPALLQTQQLPVAASLRPLLLGLLLLVFAAFLAAAVSILMRWRRSSGVERQQVKWFAYAASLAATSLLFTFVTDFYRLEPIYQTVTSILYTVAFSAVPLAIGIAILRYRLYDIDILIRRTLQYSVLSALLALVYLSSVILFGSVFRSFTGRGQTQLVTVLSTLAIAALFTPLRRRVQDVIDRRFYRRKYDAEQVLAAFGVTMRNEMDLDKLTGALVQIAEETLHPAYLSLWVRPAKEEGKSSNPGDEDFSPQPQREAVVSTMPLPLVPNSDQICEPLSDQVDTSPDVLMETQPHLAYFLKTISRKCFLKTLSHR
jgi:hypothetical protein